MIAIASDHGGYALKEHIKAYLAAKGITCQDFGTDSTESCDYPAFGKAAEVNPMGFTILVEDNATAHLQAGPAGPGGRTTLQYQKG